MSRIATSLLCGWLLCAPAGCAHHLETRTVRQFANALESEDLAALKTASSPAFEQKALRRTEALDDFRILNLPKGETSVVNVEKVSDSERKVMVEIGEEKQKLLYKLTFDPQARRWVVDDIYTRQRQEGLKVTRSVTEQMDLLLTVREFLAAWDEGGRDEVLAVATPELAELLGELPPAYLARLTRQAVGEPSRGARLKSEAELDNDFAVVRLPRAHGLMVISLKLLAGDWKVSDIAVEARGDKQHIGSVQKTATALRAAVRFLSAYEADDHPALEQVCTAKFYRAGLAPADLSQVKLPGGEVPSEYEIKLQDRRADFIVTTDTEVMKLSLAREPESVDYRVEEVTLYELDGTQEKRLSSLFTSQALVQLFGEALVERNLGRLRQSSTADFNRRVWSRLDDPDSPESQRPAVTLGDLPLGELGRSLPDVVSTQFRGAITEITTRQGGLPVTYVLREHAGQPRIDDLLIDVPGLPGSLKETIEYLLPVRAFVAALEAGRIDRLQQVSSSDFNRLVWKQVDSVPEVGLEALHHLRAPLTDIQTSPEHILITLGDDQFGAGVLLVREREQIVVEEVQLVAGPEPHDRSRLKQAVRALMARGGLALKRPVVPAAYEQPADDPPPPTRSEVPDLPVPSESAFDTPTEGD